MKRPFLLSLLLHGLGMALLSLSYRGPLPAPLVRRNVWVIETRGSDTGEKPKNAKRDRGGPSRRMRRQLKLGLAPRSLPGGSTGASSGAGDGTDRASDGYGVATAMGLEKEGKLYPFFEAVWQKVNRLTTYPQDFVDQAIQGKVTVQLEVDRRGVFTGDVKAVSAEDAILSTFAVATLVHALHEPLPKNQWMSEDRMVLVFQFEFALIGVGELPREPDYAHLKNILSIRREAHVDPAINREIDRLLTRYVPPIIPIPGGFFIDFRHAYLYVKNLIHPPPDDDKLRAQRLEMQKQEMEKLIGEVRQTETRAE